MIDKNMLIGIGIGIAGTLLVHKIRSADHDKKRAAKVANTAAATGAPAEAIAAVVKAVTSDPNAPQTSPATGS